MHGLSEVVCEKRKEIGGRNSTGAGGFAQTPQPPISFYNLAKLAWPLKTDMCLADATDSDPRTCRRWLSDETGAPDTALGVVLCEIMRRYRQRE